MNLEENPTLEIKKEKKKYYRIYLLPDSEDTNQQERRSIRHLQSTFNS